MSRSIRLHVKRQHGAARKGGGKTSFAEAAVADALDHLLDPLENLRQEEFSNPATAR
jgi:dsDNA-binding SOS-regulon protein